MGEVYDIKVGKTLSCDCKTITEALVKLESFLKEKVTIFIENGVYKEKLLIKRDNLTLIGESKENCIIQYDDYANFIMEDNEKRGTFRTASVFVDCDNFTARNISIANTAGVGREVGQAIALYVDGTNMKFENCNMIGAQDTLFIAPLPEVAYEKNGFRGPKEFEARKHGTHIYHKCYICGDVDFIFGSGTAYFHDCVIYSNDLNQEVNGYVCAPSTVIGEEGFVFNRCRFISNCKENTVYLARPWRNDGRVTILNSFLGNHIKREGFHDWNKENARKTVFFAENNNYGPKACRQSRPTWCKIISKEENKQLEETIRSLLES